MLEQPLKSDQFQKAVNYSLGNNMTVMANQQQTLSWFTGFMEGEGSANKSKSGWSIRVYNTDIELINECVKILKANYILHTLFAAKKRPKRKICYTISIDGKNECHTLIKTLGSIFQCRRQEFIDKLDLGCSSTARDASFNADIYWMIGFTEADGCIALNIDKCQRYTPVVVVNNTREKLIRKFAITLKSLDLAWYVYEHQPSRPNSSKLIQIRIAGLLRVKRFLDKTKHLFVSNYYQDRAELLSRFVESRLTKPKGSDYSEEEHNIYWQLKR